MSKVVSSTELQKKTREVIDWARIKGEAVVVETYGKPMAAILSYEEYQTYLQYKQARAQRFARLRQAAAGNADLNRLTVEEALAVVEELRQELYDQHHEAG
jgi:PHD/YefM family antitoxin component YafN of YafNO toxin-antitoxin module